MTVAVIVAVTVVCTVLVVEIVDEKVEEPEADSEEAPASFNIPPMAAPPGGEVEAVAFLARSLKASKVLPVVGALIDATMPDWQWLPCPQ